MRTLEHIYLAAAVGLVVFLALSWKEMPNGPRMGVFAGIAICMFMFSFRRSIRLKMEQAEQEHRAQANEEDEEDNA